MVAGRSAKSLNKRRPRSPRQRPRAAGAAGWCGPPTSKSRASTINGSTTRRSRGRAGRSGPRSWSGWRGGGSMASRCDCCTARRSSPQAPRRPGKPTDGSIPSCGGGGGRRCGSIGTSEGSCSANSGPHVWLSCRPGSTAGRQPRGPWPCRLRRLLRLPRSRRSSHGWADNRRSWTRGPECCDGRTRAGGLKSKPLTGSKK